MATRKLGAADSPLAELASRRGVSPAQLALARLLHKSPAMLPIPGTSNVEHLEANLAAAEIELSEEEFAELDSVLDWPVSAVHRDRWWAADRRKVRGGRDGACSSYHYARPRYTRSVRSVARCARCRAVL